MDTYNSSRITGLRISTSFMYTIWYEALKGVLTIRLFISIYLSLSHFVYSGPKEEPFIKHGGFNGIARVIFMLSSHLGKECLFRCSHHRASVCFKLVVFRISENRTQTYIQQCAQLDQTMCIYYQENVHSFSFTVFAYYIAWWAIDFGIVCRQENCSRLLRRRPTTAMKNSWASVRAIWIALLEKFTVSFGQWTRVGRFFL